MADLAALASWIAHTLGPLLWGIGAYLVVRLLILQLRRRRAVLGLVIVGQLLPLCFGLLVGLRQAGLFNRAGAGGAAGLTVLVLLATIAVLHIGDRLLARSLERQGRPDAFPRLMRDIVRGGLTVLVLFLSISQFFHVQLGTVLLSSTIFTAVVGLALQDLLKNVFAGIALQLERPFSPGDWIFIDQNLGYGRVLEMSWRAIRARTRDGHMVVVPNTQIGQQQIVNLSAMALPIAMRLKIAVDANHPPNVVQRVIKQAVLATDGVLDQPAPFVYTREMTSAAANYEVKFWVANFDRFPEQQGEAMALIWYALRRADIALAPNELVLTRPADVSERRRLHYSQEQVISRLRRINLLDVLSDEEVAQLAACVEIRLFAAGEVLAHQGARETQLFAIARGRVRVVLADADGSPSTLTELGPGEIFGEVGMLMDEPRSASVIALEDTNTIVIDRDDIAPLLER
ncbi:MAG TPA: mechanosensitive ion channel family protein, partial [Herpetosiphonaceae bacterium]